MNTEPSQLAAHYLKNPEQRPKRYHIFVYGTLKRGLMNHVRLGLHDHGIFAHESIIAGYKIVVKECLPMLVQTLKTTDKVYGEVWSIPEDYKKKLDGYEHGYELVEILKDIYAYLPVLFVEDYPEIPTDKYGNYNWTQKVELEAVPKRREKRFRARLHYEQEHNT